MARHGKIDRTPPLILAVENSGLCCSVALVSARSCLCQIAQVSQETHSQRLLATIEQVMATTGTDWPQIDALAVSLGPGSFTGLRIGLATIKGLAMAADKKIIGISSLDGLAAQIPYSPHPICPVLDARKKEIFTAMFRSTADGIPERRSDYLALRPEQLIQRITEPTIFLGDGLTIYGALFSETLQDKAILAPSPLFYPRAEAIGRLAITAWTQGRYADSANLAPLYVRASDAELQWGNS